MSKQADSLTTVHGGRLLCRLFRRGSRTSAAVVASESTDFGASADNIDWYEYFKAQV